MNALNCSSPSSSVLPPCGDTNQASQAVSSAVPTGSGLTVVTTHSVTTVPASNPALPSRSRGGTAQSLSQIRGGIQGKTPTLSALPIPRSDESSIDSDDQHTIASIDGEEYNPRLHGNDEEVFLQAKSLRYQVYSADDPATFIKAVDCGFDPASDNDPELYLRLLAKKSIEEDSQVVNTVCTASLTSLEDDSEADSIDARFADEICKLGMSSALIYSSSGYSIVSSALKRPSTDSSASSSFSSDSKSLNLNCCWASPWNDE